MYIFEAFISGVIVGALIMIIICIAGIRTYQLIKDIDD